MKALSIKKARDSLSNIVVWLQLTHKKGSYFDRMIISTPLPVFLSHLCSSELAYCLFYNHFTTISPSS